MFARLPICYNRGQQGEAENTPEPPRHIDHHRKHGGAERWWWWAWAMGGSEYHDKVASAGKLLFVEHSKRNERGYD